MPAPPSFLVPLHRFSTEGLPGRLDRFIIIGVVNIFHLRNHRNFCFSLLTSYLWTLVPDAFRSASVSVFASVSQSFTYVLDDRLSTTPVKATTTTTKRLFSAAEVSITIIMADNTAADNTATTNNNVNATAAAAPANSNGKCAVRPCKVKGAETLDCSAADCDKKVHLMCYQGMLLKHKELAPLPAGKVVCTKKCHGKVLKASSGGGDEEDGGGRRGNWDCDGKNGPTDTHTSVRILLDWWMAEGNYSKFCGKNNEGIKKIQFAEQLAQKMTRETTSKRDSKNVMSKIQHIEKQFKKAHEFATSETGAGIKENDEGTFEAAVKKKCPYYYDLLDIMSDRASSKPKATSYEDFSDDDDDEEEDEEDIVDDVSDISEEGGKSIKSSATKRTAISSTTSSKKKSRSSKKPSPILDDEAIQALSAASKTSEARMSEIVRHNMFIEKLEREKIDLQKRREERELQSYDRKSQELDYKMKLLERYKQLKDTYEWSDEQIVSFYPDMKVVMDAQKK
jgi:hypothetical protein